METAKERFAGANELAISTDTFKRDYPKFFEGVTKYTSFLKSKNKRTRYSLACRLLLRSIEEGGRFDVLRIFLRHPDREASSEIGELLQQAFIANYHTLLASNLYSEAVSLQHTRNGIAVLRWLSSNARFYPQLPKMIALKPSNPKGPRKAADVLPPFLPMSLAEIGSILGDQFHDDLLGYETNEVRGPTRTIGFRYLMSFVKLHPSGYSDAVLAALSGCSDQTCDPTSIKSVIDDCEMAMKRSKAFATTTINGMMRNCSHLFEHLSELPNRNYPHFSRRYKKFTHVPTRSGSLADLSIPGTENLTGAARLRASMSVICAVAMDVVEKHASHFKAAERLRSGKITGNLSEKERSACEAIAAVIRAELRSLDSTGKSQFSKSGVRSNSKAVEKAMILMENPATWRHAGVGELVPDVASLDFVQIMSLVRCSIGATQAPVVAAKIVFCCDTGWNRQSIEDIPREPYQFRLVDEVGVACASFVEVFKRRAGHLVQTLLEHPQLRGVRAVDTLAAWEEAERDMRWGDRDRRGLIGYTSAAYVALELVRPLVEAVDGYTRNQRVHERFFKTISPVGEVTLRTMDIALVFRDGPLATPGLTFKLIRKSYLQMMFRVVETVDALKTHAGHSGTGVLFPSYLNTPDIIRELEQSTRFFQNAVQSLVVAEVGRPLEFLMSPEEHLWFYNLAHVSGVASAVGYGVSTSVGGSPTFCFTPSDEQLRSLFAISASLDIEEKTANQRRWSLVGVPLRAFVNAVLGKLNAAGMSLLIKRVGDEFDNDLREGFVDLLPLKL